MEPDPETKLEWDAGGAALCGAVLGAMAVIGNEVYTVSLDLSLRIDPFTYVLAELAVFAVGGAVLFALGANTRNRLRRRRSKSFGAEGSQQK
jgi:predicted component of type VI protein secretion system